MSDILRLYSPDELHPSGYPHAWDEIKALVREQAGHRCVRCGHPYRSGEHGNGEWSPCDERCAHGAPFRYRWEEGDWNECLNGGNVGWSMTEGQLLDARVEARWRILTVHHLTGDWTNTEAAKPDCRWWNLASLCQRCHLQIQGKVKLDRPFLAEHTDWFKPYAAGWYAWRYEQREISREEALTRMDELLAYEQRQDRLAF